jgi:transcriptional regulator with XRE-family HTH domain
MALSKTELKVNIDYLKQYKKSKNLTNKELAEKIGVHESTISRIFSGKKGVGYKFIIGVLYFLEDIDFNKLLVKESREKAS